MIAAAGALARDWTRGRLIVAAVVDEEYMSIGAEALVREWPADVAIVTEPTDCGWRSGTKGSHGSRSSTEGARRTAAGPPRAGTRSRAWDACSSASKRAIASCAPAAAPFQGTGSLHASIISGGRELSSYPDRCTLQMERRTVSGEDEGVVIAEIERVLEALHAQDPEFEGTARDEGVSLGLSPRSVAPAAAAARAGPRAVAAIRPSRSACRSGPTPRSSPAPAFRRFCSGPAARGFTASSNTSTSTTSTPAGTCLPAR